MDLGTQTGMIGSTRELVLAQGSDTVGFLQGQLSQDIEALAPGDWAESLLLQPQGKLVAWLAVTRLDDDAMLLDVDTGAADAMIERLNRFKLRTACDLTPLAWDQAQIVGPQAADVPVEGAAIDRLEQWSGVSVRCVAGERLALPSLDTITVDSFTALCIESGRPRMGRELDDDTIPAAAGIVDTSVSFTKGCYTGQELVARIDSRGNNVPRRLVGLRFEGPAPVDGLEGAELHADAKVVGRVTSAAASERLGATVALGYVARAVDDGASVTVGQAGAGGVATVTTLPFIGDADGD